MNFQNEIPNHYWVGTGWLIDATTVVTCAHNFYSTTKKAHALNVTAYIGYAANASRDFTKIEARRGVSVAIHWGYYAAPQTKHDFAILTLRKPFKDAKPLPAKTTPLTSVEPLLRVVGYPGDIPQGENRGKVVYQSEGIEQTYDLRTTDYEIAYTLDTFKGLPNVDSVSENLLNCHRKFRESNSRCRSHRPKLPCYWNSLPWRNDEWRQYSRPCRKCSLGFQTSCRISKAQQGS